MTAPEWLVVGGRAALLTAHFGSDTARRVTIEKIGKRDVVLSDGSRVNVNTLRRSSSSYGPADYLEPIDSPRAVRAFARQRRDSVAFKVERHMRALRGGDDSAAKSALDLLAEFLGGAE